MFEGEMNVEKRLRYCVVLACFCLAGCGKEEERGERAQAISGEAVKVASEKGRGPRTTFKPIPASMFEPAEPMPAAAETYVRLLRAIAKGDLEKAGQIHEQMIRDFGGEDRFCALGSIALASACLRLDPPALDEVKALIAGQGVFVEKGDVGDASRNDWRKVRLLVHLGDVAGQVRSASDFEHWRQRLNGLAREVRLGEDDVDLLAAYAGLMREAVPDSMAGRTEAIEETLIDLQCAFLQPGVLCVLQRQRVGLLIEADRFPEALFEARVLLALSSQDAGLWLRADEQIARILARMDSSGEKARAYEAFQRFGPAERDGRADTQDDLVCPLAGAVRENAYLISKLDNRVANPADADDRLRRGYLLLLAGRGEQSLDVFAETVSRCVLPTDDACRRTVDGLAMSRCFLDGHLLGCEDIAADLVAYAGKLRPASGVWRLEARAYLERRERLIETLIARGRAELSLSLCGRVVEEWRIADRGKRVLSLAMQACEAMASVEDGRDGNTLYRQFGGVLRHPQARAYRAYLAAQSRNKAGDIAGALAELDALKDIQVEAYQYGELVLLHAYCLAHAKRFEEALRLATELCDRSDVDQDLTCRSQWLTAVIHIQQNRKIEARSILDDIIEKAVNTQMVMRARELIANL